MSLFHALIFFFLLALLPKVSIRRLLAQMLHCMSFERRPRSVFKRQGKHSEHFKLQDLRDASHSDSERPTVR